MLVVPEKWSAADAFVEVGATLPQRAVPPLPDDGLGTTFQIAQAVMVIHRAYMKNCAAAHEEERKATILRLHRQPLCKIRPCLEL